MGRLLLNGGGFVTGELITDKSRGSDCDNESLRLIGGFDSPEVNIAQGLFTSEIWGILPIRLVRRA